MLLDDLDDPPRPWLNQHCAAIHHCVSILANTVFRWNVVISNAIIGKDRSDPHILAILIGRTPLLDNIGTEAGPRVHSKDASHAANDAAYHASNNYSHRTSGPFTVGK